MDFSTPYMDDDLTLVAKEGSGITSLESAKGKSVGVQQATTGAKFAKENGLDAIGYEDGGMQVTSLKADHRRVAGQPVGPGLRHQERADPEACRGLQDR